MLVYNSYNSLCTQTRVSTAFKISDMYKISCTAVLSHAQDMHGTVLYKYQFFQACVHSTAKEYPIQDRLINQTDADIMQVAREHVV